MSLVEIISDIKDSLQDIKGMKVLGVLIKPFKNNIDMSCYTSLDLGNPTLLEYNSCIKGGYLKVPCIRSREYIILNNNKNIRKQPINDKCKDCKFTPELSDYFEVIIDYVSLGEINDTSALVLKVNDVLGKINKKFNINIEMCTLKPNTSIEKIINTIKFKWRGVSAKMGNKDCGNCNNYDLKNKRCKLDNSHKMKINGCPRHKPKIIKTE